MNTSLALCLLPLFFFSSLSLAQNSDERDDSEAEKSKDKSLKIGGYVRSFIEAENFKDGETIHEGRLEIKTKRRKGLRGQLEVDFRTKTDDVQVNQATLDRKLEGDRRFTFGYDRKYFGVENEQGRTDRTSIDRSFIYRKLDAFTYTGRETKVRWAKLDGNFHTWAAEASFSESENVSLIGNWQSPFEGSPMRYGAWLLLGTDKIEDGSQLAATMMHSLWAYTSAYEWRIEWVSGLDPNLTEFEALFDNDERIYFTGISSFYAFNLWQEDEERLVLMGGLSGFFHDVREPEYNSLGGMIGVRYDLDTLRVAANVDLIGTNSPIDLKKRSYNESGFKIEALYAF